MRGVFDDSCGKICMSPFLKTLTGHTGLGLSMHMGHQILYEISEELF